MYNSELIFKQVCYGSSRERVSNFSYLIFLLDYIHLKHIFCNIIFLHYCLNRINIGRDKKLMRCIKSGYPNFFVWVRRSKFT